MRSSVDIMAAGRRALERSVRGPVHRPGQPGYDLASRPVNGRYRAVRPVGVASVTDADDVARAVGWARDHDLDVVARGGGHSYAGNSVTRGLVLDLAGLDGVHVDTGTGLVTVGGGTPMATVAAALRPHGLAFPMGNSDTVGIGGLVLGGGVTATSRAYGLTCDALVETRIVRADGSVLTCNATSHPDLFWACRGGGGGNFGVNVSFTFQTRPVSDCSTFVLLWPRSAADVVLPGMQEVLHLAPDELSVRLGASRSPDGAVTISAVGQYLGPAAELTELLSPVLDLVRPAGQDIADRTFWAAAQHLRHASSGDPFAVRTRGVAHTLGEQGVETLLSHIDRWPGSSSPDGCGFGLFSWGGAISRVPHADTAFAHRDLGHLLSMDTSWGVADPPDVVAANLRWLAGLYEAMGAHASDAAYVNFTDPDLDRWRSAYHGAHYARLVAVKRRHDPDAVFGFAQSIGR